MPYAGICFRAYFSVSLPERRRIASAFARTQALQPSPCPAQAATAPESLTLRLVRVSLSARQSIHFRAGTVTRPGCLSYWCASTPNLRPY